MTEINNRVLNKALQVAQSRGMNISEHFSQVVEMAKVGSGTFRKVDNWHLTRLAYYGPSVSEMGFCYFVSKNFEGKENIANFAAKWFDL